MRQGGFPLEDALEKQGDPSGCVMREVITEKEKMIKSILLPLALLVAGIIALAVLAIVPILLPEARPYYRDAFRRIIRARRATQPRQTMKGTRQ
jgi:hypothetical protein